jgi:exopolysaccharide biosynthesis protein
VRTAIGGGPALLRAGKIVPIKRPDKAAASLAYSERSLFERHPRSALAWNDKYFFFIEVDGRQKNLSMGMTLPELSDYMLKLGCTDALNLDGGGSSTFWLEGRVLNSPSDKRERSLANAVMIVQKNRP